MTDERTDAPPRDEPERLWTVAELADAVARALSRDYQGAGSGRVTDVPGVRVIRWYQTIGLVDRPSEMRGRTALYGPRHLRQIVAIKRLQSAGQSLAEIQEALVGAPEEVLERVARVPGEVGPVRAAVPAPELADAASLPVAVEVEGADAAAGAGRGRFWASRAASPVAPAPAEELGGEPVATSDTATSSRASDRRLALDAVISDVAASDTATSSRPAAGARAASPAVAAEFSYGIAVAPGLTVLVSLPQAPGPAAIAAIRASAAPLVAELAAQRHGGAPTSDPEAEASASLQASVPQASAPTTTTHAPAARGLPEGASS